MPLTMTVADRAAVPAGFTATVAGTGGAAVSLYAAPADQPFAGVTWQLVGSRTGDGAVSIDAAKQFLFAFAKTPTDCTLPMAFAVTDGLDALAYRVQAAVAARVRLLGLEGIGDRVYELFMPDATEMRYPCAVTHWVRSTETEESGLNGLDYVAYPVQLDVYDVHKPTEHAARNLYFGWRDAVGKAFRHQHLPGVPESAWCDVLFGPMVDPAAAAEAGYYLGSLTVRVMTRETRGIGT